VDVPANQEKEKKQSMKVKFEIELKWKTGKGKEEKHSVFAKCLEKEKNFSLTDKSKLGDVEINNYLNQPRAINKEGKPRLDLFAFKIRYKEDCEKLKEGQIVELIQVKEENGI